MNPKSNAELVRQAWLAAREEFILQYGESSKVPEQFAYIKFLDACIGRVGSPDFEKQARWFALRFLERSHKTYKKSLRNPGAFRTAPGSSAGQTYV